MIQPGGPQGTEFPLYYPLPAVLAGVPFTILPYDAARWAFVTLGAGVLGYAVGKHRPTLWPLFLSMPFLIAVRSSQWGPYLTAAILLPALQVLILAKPNIGLAVLLRLEGPSRRWLHLAGAVAVVLLVAFAVDPGWPSKWLAALRQSTHFRPLMMRPGGFLLLLALLRWRDPDARMLLALGSVPQTGLLYDVLPALAVARSRAEALALAVMSHLSWYSEVLVTASDFTIRTWQVGTLTLWGMLIPALAIVLYRSLRPAPSP